MGTAAMSLKLDLCAAILLVGFGPPTQADDIYSHLKDRWGNSCCNDRDCRPAHYRVTPTGVMMYVQGEWITVPADTIQYLTLPGDNGETGGGHWCGTIHHNEGGTYHATNCSVLPPMNR